MTGFLRRPPLVRRAALTAASAATAVTVTTAGARALPLVLLLALVASACGGGEAGGATPAGPPATSSPAAAGEGATRDATPGGTEAPPATAATATGAAERPRAEIGLPVVYTTWLDDRGFIHVNFVTRIRNTGNVPLDLSDVRWTLDDRAGAAFAFGEVAHGYPRRLAPGETGVLGGFIDDISYSDPKEVTGVTLLYGAQAAEEADRLLEVEDVALRRDEQGVASVTGRVVNAGSAAVERLRIAIVLVDAADRWIAFAEGAPESPRLDAGGETAFASTGLVPADLPTEPVSAFVIAFDDAAGS